MRLLERYQSMVEAYEREAFLRSRGIAVHVQGTTILHASAHKNRYNASLWSVLDHQYEDAIALLENPDHHVNHPLDASEMEMLQKDGGYSVRAVIIRWSLGILAILIVLALIMTSLLE